MVAFSLAFKRIEGLLRNGIFLPANQPHVLAPAVSLTGETGQPTPPRSSTGGRLRIALGVPPHDKSDGEGSPPWVDERQSTRDPLEINLDGNAALHEKRENRIRFHTEKPNLAEIESAIQRADNDGRCPVIVDVVGQLGVTDRIDDILRSRGYRTAVTSVSSRLVDLHFVPKQTGRSKPLEKWGADVLLFHDFGQQIGVQIRF